MSNLKAKVERLFTVIILILSFVQWATIMYVAINVSLKTGLIALGGLVVAATILLLVLATTEGIETSDVLLAFFCGYFSIIFMVETIADWYSTQRAIDRYKVRKRAAGQ